jgi:hypothetical protein
MLEITSTPLVIMAILGTVGILLPIISIARKEQGSNSFYAIIAFFCINHIHGICWISIH